jgi:type II secretion system protein N
VSPRIVTVAKALLYPLFYLFCLVIGLVVSFPWDQVKHRIEAEFAKSQAPKGAAAWRLEIGELDGYWLSGVEIRSAKLIIPPDDASAASPTVSPARSSAAAKSAGGADDDGDADAPAAKVAAGPRESIVLLEEGHARVRLLPLLIGRVRVDFSMSVLGGEISGTVPVGGGDFELELEDVDLGQLAPLAELVTVPVQGVATGRMTLSAPDGKFSKASGALDLAVKNVVLGDGKAKLMGKMALPPADLGTLEIGATATAGVLQLEKFDAQGKDGEVHGAGTIKLRQPWDMSIADVYLRFGFSDAYRSTNDKTKALLGEPGQDFPPALIDQDKKMKRAKRTDGLYGFRIHGRVRALKFDPTTADGPKPTKTPASNAAGGDDDGDDADADAAKGAQFSAAGKRKTRKAAPATPKAPAPTIERPPAPPAREAPSPLPETAPPPRFEVPGQRPSEPPPPPEPPQQPEPVQEPQPPEPEGGAPPPGGEEEPAPQ